MGKTITAPADSFPAITPSDSTDFAEGVCRGIYVGVAGDVVAVDKAGNATTFKNAIAGSILPIEAKRVNATNTSASDLVALY